MNKKEKNTWMGLLVLFVLLVLLSEVVVDMTKSEGVLAVFLRGVEVWESSEESDIIVVFGFIIFFKKKRVTLEPKDLVLLDQLIFLYQLLLCLLFIIIFTIMSIWVSVDRTEAFEASALDHGCASQLLFALITIISLFYLSCCIFCCCRFRNRVKF
jgi:hypothetical protein